MSKKNKEITVSDFVQLHANKKNKMSIHIDVLGGDIEANRLPVKQVLQMMDSVDMNSTIEQLDFSAKLIYQSCPIFRDAELQKSFGDPKEPSDVVMMALGEDIGAVSSVAEQIMGFYSLVAGEELKN